jgi:hypothetical protein
VFLTQESCELELHRFLERGDGDYDLPDGQQQRLLGLAGAGKRGESSWSFFLAHRT